MRKQWEKKFPKISSEFLETLLLYDFPGNVRELQNLIEKAICITNENDTEISLKSLPFYLPALIKIKLFKTDQNEDNRILKNLNLTLSEK